MSMSRDDFISAMQAPAHFEKVTVPGFGEACVKVMTGGEHDAYDQATIIVEGDKAKPDFRQMGSALLVRTLCDDTGKRLFTDADTGLVGKLPSPHFKALVKEAQRVNMLGKEAVDTAEKN